MQRRLDGWLVCLVGLAVLLPPAFAAAKKDKKPKATDQLLQDDYPELTDAQREITEVPFAPGAPAVVLLEAEQRRWYGMDWVHLLYARRLKVLTSAGVEEYGDFSFELYGDWRVKTAAARTILPDGTEIDASEDVHRDRSDDGFEVIRVAFPRVEPGSILDFRLSIAADNAFSVSPWALQEDIPVLESRFIMFPPPGLRYRFFATRSDNPQPAPERIREGRWSAFAWTFRDVEPIPGEAHRPPRSDISRSLFVVLESYTAPGIYIPISTDWKTYIESQSEEWTSWLRHDNGAAVALAASVASGKEGTREKAEAVRVALRERIRVTYVSDFAMHDSPDQVLAEGTGTTADVAATATAMLRSLGVPADLAAIRRRTEGALLIDFPVPAMFNDLLVRLPTDGGGTFFSPASDLPVGSLPWYCTGLMAVPLDGKSEGPVPIPDVPAGENLSTRTVEAALDADGNLEGSLVLRLHGIAAESWRRRLRDEDEEGSRRAVQSVVRDDLPQAEVTALSVERLDEPLEDLALRCTFRVPSFATRAGKRLLINPVLFDRISSADWPPEARKYPVYLAMAHEERDTVTIDLPEGVTSVALPDGARLDAPPAGTYKVTYEGTSRRIVLRRERGLELYSFPAQVYPALRDWFGSMAEADERPVVVNLE